MLHPSYTDLMKVVNKDVEEGETKIVNSRYSIVMATSKRARQIIDGDQPLVNVKNNAKSLSVAIQELNEGKLKVLAEGQNTDSTETQDVDTDSENEEAQQESDVEVAENQEASEAADTEEAPKSAEAFEDDEQLTDTDPENEENPDREAAAEEAVEA